MIEFLIKFIQELFRQRAWKEISREFLREEQTPNGTCAYYFVTYQDLISGDIKKQEIEIALQEQY